MMTRLTNMTAVLAASASACAFAGNDSLPCPADLDCSGQIDVLDLLTVLGDWGSDTPSSDLNNDGTVDVLDLLMVLGDWGPCVFDFGPNYPNAEAHQIGLELITHVGPVPEETYDRIATDLALIRAAQPELQNQTHAMAWSPNSLIVAKPQDAPTSQGYECLNSYYRVVNDNIFASFGGTDYHLLTFAGKLNPVALSPIYAALPDVNFAEPDGLIGGQNFWEATDLGDGRWRWDIDDGWHDCFDGCDCHRYYIIETTDRGEVTVIDITEAGAPWCEFD